ncbi:hypothetical protein C8J57DRAFT_1726051 [Mycena rebaudengoi]|nr:hypothetical protein C8J57DRAFT_1726051 [Mycena rebaudengoi]
MSSPALETLDPETYVQNLTWTLRCGKPLPRATQFTSPTLYPPLHRGRPPSQPIREKHIRCQGKTPKTSPTKRAAKGVPFIWLMPLHLRIFRIL